MKKIISYPLSIIYYFFFGFFLLLFWPIQWICLKTGGYSLHKKSVDILNFFLVHSLYILGTKIKFKFNAKVPQNTSVIFVSNHQSLNDIPSFMWFMRKNHPKFVAKKELGKGIPSISFNLKYGGSALINRKDAKQALREIEKLGNYIEANKRSAVIFPEGTRSRNGEPKRFSAGGLKTLVEHTPSAYIVPVTINNSWKITKNGGFPLELGVPLNFEIHQPIKGNSKPFDELFTEIETTIKAKVVS